jgi:hypothetical protein
MTSGHIQEVVGKMARHRLVKNLADASATEDDRSRTVFELFGPVKNTSTKLFKSERPSGKNCLGTRATEIAADAVNRPRPNSDEIHSVDDPRNSRELGSNLSTTH